ncbi:hypothetical protein CMsap09_15900 [Clavibacter michiganensis]|uniref:Secreted protein n=1 Tax=Clavibacter michiganensis TaxID=28447 RepID=A0A251XZ39_9MICO|nr:hypothetical protein CMsap09_15900 [Clavibacter michiganensis]
MIRPARPAARGRRRRAAIAVGAAALTLGSLAIAAPANAEREDTFHTGYWHGIDVYVAESSSARGFGIISTDDKYVQCTPVLPGWNKIELRKEVLAFHVTAVKACDVVAPFYDRPMKFGMAGQTWAILSNHSQVLRK